MRRVVIGCTVVTVALVLLRPTAGIMEMDDLREGQLEAAAAMVTTVAGSVLLGHFRRDGSRLNLILGTGLLLLAMQNGFAAIAIPMTDALGSSNVASWTVVPMALLGTVTVAAGAWLPDGEVRYRRRAAWLAAAVTVGAFAGTYAVSRALAPRLGPVFERMPVTAEQLHSADLHPAVLAALVLTAGAWAAAATGLARLAATDGDAFVEYLGHGASLFAAAYLLYAWFPSHLTELLHGGDLLLLVAIGTLLYGSVRQATSTEEVLVRSAVRSERRRVAGELRAGVAQELALIAVQTEQISGSSAEADAISRSVERALVESRGAIASLGRPVDESLADAVGHAARDAADRLGVSLDLRLDDHVDATREWREALARITREGMAIAVHRGGATTVAVELHGGRRPALRVLHDGPRSIAWDSGDDELVATRALRERAEGLGGMVQPAASTVGDHGFEVVLP